MSGIWDEDLDGVALEGAISIDELEGAAREATAASLSATALAGELTTGRMAVVNEPQEPVDWEDRVRSRRLRHVGL